MKSGNKHLLIIAVILGLVTTALVFLYIQGVRKSITNVETKNVVMAVQDINEKAAITSKDVKLVKLDKKLTSINTIGSISEVLGKKVKTHIYAGEQIIADRIVNEAKDNLSYKVPEGKRAVSINVDECTEVANLICPGDRVDVLATFDSTTVDDFEVKYLWPNATKTILQNIEILALGQALIVSPVPQNKVELPKTVTVAVTPEEAEKLVYGEKWGALTMTLRRAGDDKMVETPSAMRNDLISNKGMWVIRKK